MGLDMSLYKANKCGGEPIEIGYWRKANAIHKWFVDNVQNGIDDKNDYKVSKNQIENLLKICKLVKQNSELIDIRCLKEIRYQNGEVEEIWGIGKIIKDNYFARKYLPTQDGFFFGSTQYNGYYLEDIEDTIEILTKIIETVDFNTETIYYSSSW